MSETLEEQVQKLLASMDNQEQQEPETNTQPPGEAEQFPPAPDEIQDIYVLILREQEEATDNSQVVDSTPILPQKTSFLPAYAICCFYILLIVSTLAFQVYEILNPLIATVTIIPKSQTVTLTGTLQLGRVLPPLTISQSQTTPTTGKGHQDARSATGFITFYNGQLNSVTIPAGTILAASNGVQVITEQDAIIPAASPPLEGQATITAHAVITGIQGNIPTKGIHEACCTISVLTVNLTPFTGGQNQRDFQTVAKSDINTLATPLKIAVAQSINAALQGQLTPQEQLQLLPCSPTVTSDHAIGQEAIQVKVTVSQTCSAVAYNREELAEKATSFLSTQALQQIRTGYSLFGTVQVSVTQATVTNNSKMFVSFHAQGTWVYALSQTAQQQIKNLIAGKSKQKAVTLFASLPGMKQASIRFDGFGDDTRLPKNPANIHLVLIFSA